MGFYPHLSLNIQYTVIFVCAPRAGRWLIRVRVFDGEGENQRQQTGIIIVIVSLTGLYNNLEFISRVGIT